MSDPEELCPNISVIIPVYNGAETIGDCLKAIVGLDYPREKLDIIVVDDGSTDGTTDIIESYREKKIQILKNELNRGRAYTRLRGAEAGVHDRLLFVDSRVIISPDALRGIVKVQEPVQIPFVQSGNMNRWDFVLNTLRKQAFKQYYNADNITHIDSKNFDTTPKGTTALFIPKNLFLETTRKIEYEDPYVSEDTKLLLNVVNRNLRIFINREFQVTYLQRDGLSNNIRHLYERGPRFVDYYFGRHKKYTIILSAGILCLFLFFIFLVLKPLWTIGIAMSMAVLFLTICVMKLAASVNEAVILFLYIPVVVISFGLGAIKGLLLKLIRIFN